MISKNLFIFSLIPLAWVVCSNQENPKLQRQTEANQKRWTRHVMERSLGSLEKKPQDKSCHTLMALEPQLDAWGRMLRCSAENDRLSLISAGPDREFNSSDDIELTLSAAEI